MKPKMINPPCMSGMTKLTPPQLNAIRFSSKHTVLTPDLLRQMRTRSQSQNK